MDSENETNTSESACEYTSDTGGSINSGDESDSEASAEIAEVIDIESHFNPYAGYQTKKKIKTASKILTTYINKLWLEEMCIKPLYYRLFAFIKAKSIRTQTPVSKDVNKETVMRFLRRTEHEQENIVVV